MQIVLFLTLGLLVFPSEIIPVIGLGLLISIFLILVARPLAVMISLLPFRMKLRRRLYISWVGLRGAVPIVFATYPLLAGIEKADMIFDLVFFISVTSVLIQGTTLIPIAKWLHVALPVKVKPLSPTDVFLSERIKTAMEEFEIKPDNHAVGKKIVELNFPKTAIIALIKRNKKYLTPGGSTVIEPNDTLIVLSDNQEGLSDVYECLNI
jgi:potassium/hydrogen antiporter